MIRSYKYRAYPNKGEKIALEMILEACRQLYNTALEHRNLNYKDRKHKVNYYDQANALKNLDDPIFDLIHSQVQQDVLKRLQKSFDSFFRRIKNGEKPGYPRFKPANRYHSFTYPQATQFLINPKKKGKDKVKLGKFGSIDIRYHRPIPKEGKLKTCTVLRKNQKWYLIFVIELPNVEKNKDLTGEILGIDVGLEKFLTDSEGNTISNPRFYRKSEEKLKKEQRKLSRKSKKSNNYKKQSLKVARQYEKIANQRRDFLFKTAKSIVDQNPIIKVEALQIRNMLKNHKLAKSIADAGWGTFFSILENKAEEAGGLVMYVNPAGTSQTCTCGELVPKTLKDRIHICPKCGLVKDRDEVSAEIIRDRRPISRSGTDRSNACGEEKAQASSLKQEKFAISK